MPPSENRPAKTPASASVSGVPEAGRAGSRFIPVVVVAAVLMVKVVLAAAPLGVTVAGAKLHAACDGNPEQAKVTA